MTLILSEVATLLTATAAWLAIVVALGLVAGLGATRLCHCPPAPVLRTAVLGGLLSAGLSWRLGFGDPISFEVWGRPLPPLWVLGGAVVGSGLALLRRSRISGRGEGSTAYPGPGEARS